METANCGGGQIHVTAVELDGPTAQVYADHFPNDTLIVGDAHEYLLNHYHEFDFIWSSPPCPSHSKLNTFLVPNGHRELEYPDMKLYQEIILLKHWFEGKWVVENVVPYYDLLIPGKIIDRHVFWSNLNLGHFTPTESVVMKASSDKYLEQLYGYDLSKYKGTLEDARKNLRNCVHPEVGKHVLDCAMNVIRTSKIEQPQLF